MDASCCPKQAGGGGVASLQRRRHFLMCDACNMHVTRLHSMCNEVLLPKNCQAALHAMGVRHAGNRSAEVW